jgi:hypothetical protein
MTISKMMLLYVLFTTMTAHAENYPDLNEEDEFSLMGALSDHDWHDLKDERWNAQRILQILNRHFLRLIPI